MNCEGQKHTWVMTPKAMSPEKYLGAVSKDGTNMVA